MATMLNTTRESLPETSPPTTSLSDKNSNSALPAESEENSEPVNAPRRTSAQTTLIVFSLCASVFLAALDMTIIATALPTIADHFKSSAAYTWVGSAYMLANAGGTPIWGKLSDIWGRKPMLLIVTVIFFIGSVICGAAVNMNMLIAGRTIQGLGAGGLLVLVNIVISDLFSMRERPKYYGFVGMTWALASATGPVVGAVLAEKAIPITGAAFLIILFILRIHTPRTPILAGLAAVDWFGAVTIVGATVMVLLGLTLGGVSRPWNSPIILCLLIFGAVLFVLFGFIEWRFARYPIMLVAIFNNTSNIASYVGCFFHGALMILCIFYLPLYFQSVLSATVILSGVWSLPMCLSISFSAMATGWYISTSGKYLGLIRLAFAFATFGVGLLISLPHNRSWAQLVIYQILIGLGIGPNFQALLVAMQNQVQSKDRSTATATFGFVRNLSTSIAIVIGNVVFQNGMEKKQVELRTALGAQAASFFSGKTAEARVFMIETLTEDGQISVKGAFYSSLRNVWIVAVVMAAMGLIASVFVKGKELSAVHEEVRTGLQDERKVERESGDQSV